jgi:hypothetical protein
MAYSDFNLAEVVEKFTLTLLNSQLFEDLLAIAPSAWLDETLGLSLDFGLKSGSEKARSEFIVAPILLETERINNQGSNQGFAIYSGKNLDADRDRGLIGECDFILSKGAISYTIQTPIFALVEAKKNDVESGLGQCIAQMIGAQIFNLNHQEQITTIYGCVTTGERWQFLKLVDRTVIIDSDRYYINEIAKIIGCLQRILDFYLVPEHPKDSLN